MDFCTIVIHMSIFNLHILIAMFEQESLQKIQNATEFVLDATRKEVINIWRSFMFSLSYFIQCHVTLH